jgi:hypothetical protein
MKRVAIIAWILAGMILVATLSNLIPLLTNLRSHKDLIALGNALFFFIMPIVFGFLAALIVSRQPENVIGWLLYLPALSGVLPIDAYIKTFASAPVQPPPQLLLALWFSSWSWLLLIFPIFFIPMLFPTGRPPSPRWRWLIVAGLVMCGILLFIATFNHSFSAENQSMNWTLANPIGFLPDLGNYFMLPWLSGLLLLTVLSVTSLFVRYRHAAAIEREQIKWLLYACSLFAAFYTANGIAMLIAPQSALNNLFGMLWIFSILTIPVSISIAILRYRLWDIDVIIRRTLIYGVLTVILGVVFFGGVVLLQQLFGKLTGVENSPVAIVVSTLAIAALFNPLRNRIQNGIDRRFYRKKYNSEQALAQFATTSRNETDIERLSAELIVVVQENIQPATMSLWLKPSQRGLFDLHSEVSGES